MATNRQEVRIGDDIYSEEEEHMDPNSRGGNNNEEIQKFNHEASNVSRARNRNTKGGRDEYYHEGDLQVWKDRSLKRDEELKDMTNKLTNL
ncbi:hypothetical protein ACSBR2_012275 [Camellia fascicularis]